MSKIHTAKCAAMFAALLAVGSGCAQGEEQEGPTPSPSSPSGPSERADVASDEASDDAEPGAETEEKALKDERCCAFKHAEEGGGETTFYCWDMGRVTRLRAATKCTEAFGPDIEGIKVSSRAVRNGRCEEFPSCPPVIQL